MDTFQIIQSVFWIIIAVDITAVCVYLILVLQDLRTAINKSNKIIDKVGAWENFFNRPLAQIAETVIGITELIKTGKNVSSLLSKRKEK